MKGAIENYLKENIDENIYIQPWDGKKRLPIFLVELFNFYEAEILGHHCLLIEILKEAPGIEYIKKYLNLINNTINIENIVFIYKNITWFRRKSLIQNRISFIVEDGQMYLPFLGLDLKKILNASIDKEITFSTSTQLVFLYLLYNGKERPIYASELSAELKTSLMTISRNLNDLYYAGLLTYEITGKTGRTKEYKRIGDPEYYLKGSRYLKNPVTKIVYSGKYVEDVKVAGLDALSIISMINPPKNHVIAMSKEGLKEIEPFIVKDNDRIADEQLTEIEVWSYDPTLLSKEKYVDLVSLALSLKEINDERIEQALEERFNGETWYTG